MRKNKYLGLAVFFADILIIAFGMSVMPGSLRVFPQETKYYSLLFYVMLFCGLTILNDGYLTFHKINSQHLAKKMIRVYLAYFVLLLFTFWRIKAFSTNFYIGSVYCVFIYIYIPVMTSVSRLLFLLLRKEIRKRHPGQKRDLYVIGDACLIELINHQIINNTLSEFNLAGYYSDDVPKEDSLARFFMGKIDEIKGNQDFTNIHLIICSLESYANNQSLRRVINDSDNCMRKVYFISNKFIYCNNNLMIDNDVKLPIFSTRRDPLDNEKNIALKRLLDVFISSIVTIFILSWLIPIIGFLIKLESRGPVFFIQKRTGYDNKDFDCIKFRSMYVNKESDLLQAERTDKRITRIGAFLRKTSLDEMPQFLNVLKGDMSIVGPRPHMLAHTRHYAKEVDKYMVRHYVLPGITGWAQVNGCRGETRKTEDMAKRIHYDIWYLENWSIWLDVKILFLTAFQEIIGDPNAY